ncbi:MAG TPA: metalloregulator ArsR/SmtB family transcription factor [Bryobacteraceae bacterium]|jgi:predicted ArsR family transcriptional regulator
MAGQMPPSGARKTRRAVVKLLKTEGPMDSAQLAEKLGLTAMGVRQHLYALQQEKLVTAEERPVPLGRPAKYWQLTREADRLFPDAYAELSVAILGALGDTFGPAGLERVLATRSSRQQASYAERIPRDASLRNKLQALARIRSEEGYMAEVKPDGPGAFLFIENHCPICAAATACQGFCTTELDLFRGVLGPDLSIERLEHIVSGERRCAYRVAAR